MLSRYERNQTYALLFLDSVNFDISKKLKIYCTVPVQPQDESYTNVVPISRFEIFAIRKMVCLLKIEYHKLHAL
jgi:hypothetical protein